MEKIKLLYNDNPIGFVTFIVINFVLYFGGTFVQMDNLFVYLIFNLFFFKYRNDN